MKRPPPQRLFDVPTADRLSSLADTAREHSLVLSVDYWGERAEGKSWIVQLFDHAEKQVVSGRGTTLSQAVRECLDRWQQTTGLQKG